MFLAMAALAATMTSASVFADDDTQTTQSPPPDMGMHQRGGAPLDWTADEMQRYLAMSEEERTAYLEEQQAQAQAQREEAQAYYDSLTDDEKAVLDAVMGRGKDGKGKPGGMFEMTEEEQAAFDAMTDEEKQAYMEEKRAEWEAERAAEREKIDAMTDEEREAYFAEQGPKMGRGMRGAPPETAQEQTDAAQQ